MASNSRASPHHNQRLLEAGSGGGVGGAPGRPGPASAASQPAGGPGLAAGRHATFKGHQRRQSVARLLPDISKLRLLSWLVEASSELINCNVAIMDGVYAKLNKSQESLLFWTTTQTTGLQAAGRLPAPALAQTPAGRQLVISQQRRKQQKQLLKQQEQQLRRASKQARNHHSLPLTNYDASSMAAVSFISAGSSSLSRSARTQLDSDSARTGSSGSQRRKADASSLPAAPTAPQQLHLDDSLQLNSLLIGQNSTTNPNNSDSNQSDDDGNSSAASSSTSSSGIHGIATSLSSSSSGSSSGSSRSSAASSAAGSTAGLDLSPSTRSGELLEPPGRLVSSAEQLSEKIRRTVMEHNYIQSLLVNIIRQHDRQRDLLNQQRRRQLALEQQAGRQPLYQAPAQTSQLPPAQKIDLADIADALDDGCACACHSDQQHRERTAPRPASKLQSSQHPAKAATLPGLASSSQSAPQASGQLAGSIQVPARKVRRSKKSKAAAGSRQDEEEARRELLRQLPEKLCESCLETHFWLHGNANSPEFQLEPLPAIGAASQQATQTQLDQLNTIISRRNATFIKLVQQEVRATIGKSIELIDLIRRQIKSPESIKQKQLMRCFSTSIQLLTSVGNYVVPAQDISSFIPEEIGHNQTSLFSLPSSDFDHLLLYSAGAGSPTPAPINHQPTGSLPPSAAGPSQNLRNQANNQQALTSNYHLAPAPEIPVRRKFNQRHQLNQRQQQQQVSASSLAVEEASSGSKSLPPAGYCADGEPNATQTSSSVGQSQQTAKIKAEEAGLADSSSGASSNNSSASSSIARGAVQQSSLTRAQTSSALLDGLPKTTTTNTTATTNHDLSYDAIANLSRQQTGDDMFLQSRPKFWQSPKFNFIKKLLHVKEQRLLRQQSKDRRIYNNKVQNKFRLVMMDLTHFNKSQQLLTTENGVNSLLTSMRNVLEFGLYLTLKLY